MNDVSRRTWLKAIAGISMMPSPVVAQPPPALSVVRSRVDRTGVPHKAAVGNSHIDFKVVSSDSHGGVFIMENRDLTPGGPPRHLHYSQEEWFYLVDGGELRIEIGDEKLTLQPGDSVLAPRNVPHVWAYVGARPGRMIIAFTPAGDMEDFFVQQGKPTAVAGDARVFEAHGMKVIGPPLKM